MNLGLNPFEFRAGLERTGGTVVHPPTGSLNPFEFRAGLEPTCSLSLCCFACVLIPLNSGLAWSMAGNKKPAKKYVLIPLNSGLAWSEEKPEAKPLDLS